MGAVYIFIILICRVVQHMCNKETSNGINGEVCFFKYGAFRNLVSAGIGFIFVLISGNGFKCDVLTAAVSLFSGVMLTLSMWCGIEALKSGSIALSSMFGTAGIIVPCIAGIFLFDEPMSAAQWFGIILFFISAYLLVKSSGKLYKKLSFKDFLLLLGVMLTNGCTMLAQQLFANFVPDGDVSVFSFLSFGIVGLFMLTAIPTVNVKYKSSQNSPLTPKLLILGVALSVAVFIINQLATLAASMVLPVVLFTFINGGSTIIGTVIAALFFKEKLTLRSVCGVLLGVASLVIIKAF